MLSTCAFPEYVEAKEVGVGLLFLSCCTGHLERTVRSPHASRHCIAGCTIAFPRSYAIAQEITATILGTVTDASGAVVSGATIIVVNTDQAKP